MAAIVMSKTWNVQFTTEELRIVLKALGQRLKNEDLELAKELGDQLTQIRIDCVRNLAQQMEVHQENLGKFGIGVRTRQEQAQSES